MRVYVACASRSWQRARRVIASLKRAGIEVTQDWPEQVAESRSAGLSDADLSLEERREIAASCLAGVRASDLVLWLYEPSDGASFEVGYGYAFGVPFIVSGRVVHPIYGGQADAWLLSDGRAIEHVVRLARERGRMRLEAAQ